MRFVGGKVSSTPDSGYIDWPQSTQPNVTRSKEASGNLNNLLPDVPTNRDGSYVIDFMPPNQVYASAADEALLIRRTHAGEYQTDTRNENIRIKLGDKPPATAKGKK